MAINAVIAPWSARGRPMALAKAYNGASIGGVIFSPLWVALITHLAFVLASFIVGFAMVAVVAVLAPGVFAQTPEVIGQWSDQDEPETLTHRATVSQAAHTLPARCAATAAS